MPSPPAAETATAALQARSGQTLRRNRCLQPCERPLPRQPLLWGVLGVPGPAPPSGHESSSRAVWTPAVRSAPNASAADTPPPPVGARQGGDLFVTAVQVMNIAIATNWHVAAAHTKA